MADLHIERKHTLGLKEARKIAFNWAEQVESDLGMQCTYEEGRSLDRVSFSRSGVKGELQVSKDKFELDAKLGFLIGAFKDRIEAEIGDMLSKLLPSEEAVAPKAAGTGKTAKKK
ncbi:MAG: polyhydroxyalkanoic acid system family protein [Betaproteobacteria bacterium]